MGMITDIFNDKDMDVVTLSTAIQQSKKYPTEIGDSGIYEEVGIPTTTAAIEVNQGAVALIPSTKRDGPGTAMQDPKRRIFNITIPHFEVENQMFSSDFPNVRAFGTTEPLNPNTVTARKLADMRRVLDITYEYSMMKCFHGKVAFPTGSVDSDLDLFTQTGLTNLATDEVTVDFVLNTSTTDVQQKCADVYDAMESALGSTAFTGIKAYCGREFFRKLITHAEVRDDYLMQRSIFNNSMAGQVSMGPSNRRRFTYGGIEFVEYYGLVSSQYFIGSTANTSERWARFVPLGTELFKTYMAPADLVKANGTMGQSFYAYSYDALDKKSIHLSAQTNRIPICLRPKCLIKGIRHTGD